MKEDFVANSGVRFSEGFRHHGRLDQEGQETTTLKTLIELNAPSCRIPNSICNYGLIQLVTVLLKFNHRFLPININQQEKSYRKLLVIKQTE